MKRKFGRGLAVSLIAIALVSAMIFSFAESDKPAIDADKIVDTTTDATLVESPFTKVVSGVQESVVGVNNYQNYYYSVGRNFGARGTRESIERLASTGSGVVIYDKYVLTNYHVVEGAARVSVSTLGSEEELAGEVVGYDESIDIAIVYVPDLNLPYVPLGDSDQLQVGEWAICIGNPLAEELRGTVTVGIISALDREIESTATTDKYGLRTTTTNAMIQTDAAINSGNSGGGLFNTLGQLMGIPSMKYTGSYYTSTSVEGIGLAIPINSAKTLIREVLEKGVTTSEETVKTDVSESQTAEKTSSSPRMGVTVDTISRSNNEAVYAGALPAGAIIIEVEEDSPAMEAGLKKNDIVVEANDTLIQSSSELSQQLTGKNPGDVLRLKVYRVEGLEEAETVADIGSGEYVDIDVTLTDFH